MHESLNLLWIKKESMQCIDVFSPSVNQARPQQQVSIFAQFFDISLKTTVLRESLPEKNAIQNI